MIDNEVRGVEFIAINTDSQDLANSKAGTRVQIGKTLARGLGAGAHLDIGIGQKFEASELFEKAEALAEKLYGAGGLGVVYLIWETAAAES